jgi:hypothetical protein
MNICGQNRRETARIAARKTSENPAPAATISAVHVSLSVGFYLANFGEYGD